MQIESTFAGIALAFSFSSAVSPANEYKLHLPLGNPIFPQANSQFYDNFMIRNAYLVAVKNMLSSVCGPVSKLPSQLHLIRDRRISLIRLYLSGKLYLIAIFTRPHRNSEMLDRCVFLCWRNRREFAFVVGGLRTENKRISFVWGTITLSERETFLNYTVKDEIPCINETCSSHYFVINWTFFYWKSINLW